MAAAKPAGVTTGRPSSPASPTPMDSSPDAGASASLAAGAATLLATVVLVHSMSARAVYVCRLLRARTFLGFLNTKYKGFVGVSRGCTEGPGELTLRVGLGTFS